MTSASSSIIPKQQRGTVLVLTLIAFVVYAINVDFTLYGDAALYADFVVLRKFDSLTLHLGYYWLLFLADRLLSTTFGLPIHETAVWLNVAAGALAVGVSYLLALEILKSSRQAVVCALLFAISGRVLTNATTSEMYMPQTLAVLTSFYLFARDRMVGAGIMSAVGLLISPLSAFAYLFFPVFDYQRHARVRWQALFTLAGAAGVVYLPFLAVHGRELLWGTRGLLAIRSTTPADPVDALRRFPVYHFKAFTVLSLLGLPLLLSVRRHARVIILALAVAVPHLYIIFRLRAEDNVFILNTDFFFVALLAIGWDELYQVARLRFSAPLIAALHVGLFLAAGTLHGYSPNTAYADDLREIAANYLRDSRAILVTDWGRAVSLTFLGRSRPSTTLTEEALFRERIFDIEASDGSNRGLLRDRTVFLYDEWSPTPLNRLFRGEESLRKLYAQHSIVSIAKERLHIDCSLLQEKRGRLYRCTGPTE